MRIGGTCRRESQLPLLLHLRLKRVPDSLHARVHAGPESVECESDFSRNRNRQRIGQQRIRVDAIKRAANQPDKYTQFTTTTYHPDLYLYKNAVGQRETQ